MKCFAILASLALAVASTNAADCTVETISTVQTKPEFVAIQSACGDLVAGVSTVSTTDAALKKVCDDNKCLPALEAAIKVVPDCLISGASFKKQFENQYADVQTKCKNQGATTASTSTGSGASTVATATAAVTVAVVAVLAQL